jgi:hypothetical protein
VHKTAIRASKHPGFATMDQFCSIYNYLLYGNESIKGWMFISNPRTWGWQHRAYANETLRIGGDLGFSGVGDSIDFAIAASSLVESIGGTTRIIFAQNPKSSHVYSEVYIGDNKDNHTKDNLEWLRANYNVKEIFVHTDLRSGELWLNFDFLNTTHPGGPFVASYVSFPIPYENATEFMH